MAIWYSIRKYLLKIHLIQPSGFPGQPITTEDTSILNGTQAVSCLSIRLQTKETHTHTQRVRTFPPVIYPVRYGHQTNVGTADSPFDTTYYRPERRTFVARTPHRIKCPFSSGSGISPFALFCHTVDPTRRLLCIHPPSSARTRSNRKQKPPVVTADGCSRCVLCARACVH